MKTFAPGKKLLALALSLLLIAAVFPLAAVADGGEFVSENLLLTKLDADNSHGILFDHRGKTVSSSTNGGISANGVVAGLVDGNTEVAHDIWGMSSNYSWGEGYNWYGVQYKLTEASFASHVTIYADYAGMEHRYAVYASESEADLYLGINLMGAVTCNGTAQTIKVNKTVQYIAFVFDPITTGDTNARPKEIELWSADAQAAFTPVDLTDASLGKYTAFGAVTLNPSTLIPTAANFGASSNDSTLTKLQYITSNVAGSHEDFNPNSNYGAFQFTFDQMYYIGDVLIDSDLWTLDQDWAVYASTTSANLYSPESLIVDNISAKYAQGNRVTLNTYAQYVAIVFKGYTRVRAIRIYTADSTGVPLPFVSENVLLNRSGCSNASPFYKNISTGAVTDDASFYYPVYESRFIAYTDGNISTHNDMRGFNTGTYRVGARYELTEPTYIGSIVLYASIGQSYPEAYSIYASSSLEDLLSDSSKLVDNQGTTGAAIVAPVNDYIQYIAFVCESYTGNPRFREIEAWTAQVPENYKPPFASENALRTSLDTATGKVQYISSGNIVNEGVVTAEELPLFTDGDTATHEDLAGSLDWGENSRKPGAEFALTEAKYIGEIRLYAGFSNLPETYTVYASDSLETLYAAENKLADGVTAAGETVTIAVNKQVQYIALFCDSYTGNPRFKEIEAWTAEEPEIFVSENALRTSLDTATGKVQYISSGNIVNEGVVTAEELPLFTDGDTATHEDLAGSLDWGEDSRKPGAEFALTEAKYIGEIRLYAGFSNLPETYTVYASDSLGTLYTAANKLADGVTAAGETVTIAVNKEVQYIALFCDSYTGNPRFKEIEAWTADPNAASEEPQEPEEPTIPEPLNDGVTRVLTIGNSFAENASLYASEIAYANSKQLMFGYLKYPSCTLQRHLYDAENDVAEFKFQVTSPNGERTTIADGSSTFASVKQALFYTHWDVIVFQQESSNARNYQTYSYLAGLIEYVKDYYPDAKLMFHQVWRWGEWEADQFDLIKAASENAASDYGLPLIPSGLAFEYAREEIGDVTAVNENDGHYQHANTYGMFLAGCCYVGAIFDIQIDPATFASHPYVNDTDHQYAATLVEAANKALLYYGGDLDGVPGLGSGDLALMMQSLLGEGSLSNAVLDANRDGEVDIRDLVHLKKAIAATAEAVAPLYTLKTQDNRLLLNNAEVSLQGVNVPQLSWSSYGDGSTVEGASNADTAVATAIAWDSEIVRLAVDPDLYMNGGTGNGGGQNTYRSRVAYRSQIDGYIDTLTAQGIPVVLDCHAYGGVTEEIMAFWQDAAARYDDNELVLFGLLNEPISEWGAFFEGGTAYLPSINNGELEYDAITCIGIFDLIAEIRQLSDNVLVIGGIHWAGDLSGFLSGAYAPTFAAWAQTGNGIMLDIHVYQTKLTQTVKNQIAAAAALYPVLIGEYGPDTREGVLSQLTDEEAAFLETVYDLIDQNGLSSTAWSLGAHPYLTDTLGNITAIGQSVRAFIASH